MRLLDRQRVNDCLNAAVEQPSETKLTMSKLNAISQGLCYERPRNEGSGRRRCISPPTSSTVNVGRRAGFTLLDPFAHRLIEAYANGQRGPEALTQVLEQGRLG